MRAFSSIYLAVIWAIAHPACSRKSAAPERPKLEVFARFPVPAPLSDLHGSLVTLQQERKFLQASDLYPELVEGLRSRWGETDPKLAPYHYNHCLALKLAGRLRPCLSETEKGLAAWPTSVQHRLLDATTRMELARREVVSLDSARRSLEPLLKPENAPAVRQARVEPHGLRLQWASVLLERQRAAEALEEVDLVLREDADSTAALELRANLLMALERSREALPVLEKLRSRKPSDALDLLLGTALLDCDRADEAWPLFERLLGAKRQAATAGSDDRLRLKAAATLRRLGRFATAREVLLPHLLDHPEDLEGLPLMARILRGAGASAAGAAVEEHADRLIDYHALLDEARKAKNARRAVSARYYEARSFLEIDRPGDALEVIDRGLEAHPRAVDLHLLRSEIWLQLGRAARVIDATARAAAEIGSPLLDISAARLLVQAEKPDAARRALSQATSTATDDAAKDAAARAHAARCFLELGEYREVEKFIASSERDSLPPDAMEIAYLCAAELYLKAGEADEARALLGNRFTHVAGGSTWAAALRLMSGDTPSDRSVAAELDVSDLVDHPRLLDHGLDAALPPELRPRLDAARRVVAARRRLLRSMAGFSDTDVAASWNALLDLYLSEGALRKARQCAWYLWSRPQRGVEEHRWLARALRRPGEVFARWAVVRRGLSLRPDDEELLRLAAGAVRFLEVAP